MLQHTTSQPDILEVIADLSNDEVFTPPRVANAVLDMLPDEVWRDPNLRWLDPGTKTGVFLREITRRLLDGLAEFIPDEDERLEHILTNMVFGLAITELTGLMARRTLYCSKNAAGPRSVVGMSTHSGNVWMRRIEHSYVSGRCQECGASEEQMERENRDNYAYAFIHEVGLEAVRKDIPMRFDVIVGNPPYQMDDVGGHRPVPIYHRFVEQAMALNPRYIAFITPSRWMAGGLGLSEYRSRMLADKRLRALVDYPVASEIFAGVEIKGGVSYFLWDRDHEGTCSVTLRRGDEVVGPFERDLGEFDVFVRDQRAMPLLRRVIKAGEPSFSDLVASVRPFGDQLRSNFRKFRKSSNGKTSELKLYMNEGSQRRQYWVDDSFVANNIALSRAWKIYLPKAGSDGGQRLPDVVLGRPFVGGPKSVCTETYLAIGPFRTKSEAESAMSYLSTRFARFLISLRKPGQDNVPSTFLWLPRQTWDRPWTDEDLFKKYRVTPKEQEYISAMVREMPS